MKENTAKIDFITATIFRWRYPSNYQRMECMNEKENQTLAW